MADEILTTYSLDIKNAQASLNTFGKTLVATDETGKKAFTDIGNAAEQTTPKINKVAQSAATAGRSFNGLQNSINQLTREAPAFAVSINTGILALSNNIPILSDEINKLRLANAQLAAQGQATIPVWKQIATSFLSWNTALSVGITLLTLFGGKLFDFIAGSENSADAAKKEADALKARNDELQRQQDLVNNVNKGIRENIKADQDRRANSEGGLNQQKRELELLKAKKTSDKEIFDQEQIIRAIELDNLKTTFNNLELYGEDRLELANAIQNKENEIVAAGLEFERKEREKAAEEDKKRKEKAAKEAKELEERRLAQLRMFLEAETAISALRVSAARDAYKELGNYYKGEIGYIEDLQKSLLKEASDEKKTIKRRQEILQQGLENGLISQEQYADGVVEIEKTKSQAIAGLTLETANAFGALGQIVGQQTEAGKTLAEAETLISTYVSAQKAYESAAILGPIAGAAAAVLATISGLGRVAQIQAVQVPQPTPVKATYFKSASGFAEGVVDLQGPGTGTSDDIPAFLSKGESVIKAKSTAAKKDELRALNYSVMDYDRLIQDKYVKPALEAQRKEQQTFAENIAHAISVHTNMGDKNIVKAINKNKPAGKKDIQELTEAVKSSARKQSFLSKHGV